MKYVIATKEDIPSLFTMILEFAKFQKEPDGVENNPERMAEDWDTVTWIMALDENNKPCGYASFCYTYHTWKGKSAFLDDLYIRESYRGCGIGKGILDEVKAICINKGCIELRWLVSDWNHNAQDFYKNYGASITSKEYNCSLRL